MRLAIAIARSGRFSGEIRPRKVSIRRPARAEAVEVLAHAVAMVAIQFARAAASSARARSRPGVSPASTGRPGQVLEVEPAVQRGHGPLRQLLEDREVDEIDVEVEDVELVRPAVKLVQHGEMGGEIGQRVRVEPDGLVAAGTSLALVRASAPANSTTSCPRSTRASVRWATILSVPP